MSIRARLAATVLLIGTASCERAETTYTLYRTSIVPGVNRVHWASFDANTGADYNQGNCMLAAELLSKQEPKPAVTFWCELGPVRDADD